MFLYFSTDFDNDNNGLILSPKFVSHLFSFHIPAPSGLKIFFSQSGKLCVTAAFHLTWIYTAEMFPTRYRSLAVGEGSCVARMGSICSPYIIDILVSLFFECY